MPLSQKSTKPVWHRAAAYAARAHEGQTRPNDDTPFIAHPARVAVIVSMLFECQDAEVIAASLLHDVVEKTSATLDDITEHFGERISHMVDCLSKAPDAVNDEAYYTRLDKADWQTRLIKLADSLDHLEETHGQSPDKILKAGMALNLAFSNEPPMIQARELLTTAITKYTSSQEFGGTGFA